MLLLALLGQQSVWAQKGKFIEISATDTIQLKALSLTYDVQIGQGTIPFMSIPIPMPTAEGADSLLPAATVYRMLAQNNFSPRFAAPVSYRLPATSDSVIQVSITSESELGRLYLLLKSIRGVSGRISNSRYESIDTYKQASFQRLYERARQDAALLAGVSGGSVGKLLSVQETASNSITDMMAGYSKLFEKSDVFSSMFGSENPLSHSVERKLVFRFELK
ncbi:hypothetical protein GCM10028786_11550 [Flaviaesturariibacter terrae]